jgi:hypothetical protein
VNRARGLFRAVGINALRPIKPPGRANQVTPEFLAAVKNAVATNSLTFGYGFSTRWPPDSVLIWQR